MLKRAFDNYSCDIRKALKPCFLYGSYMQSLRPLENFYYKQFLQEGRVLSKKAGSAKLYR